MDTFAVPCVRTGAELYFANREPQDLLRSISYFRVGIKSAHLNADARVYVVGPTPVRLFNEMAQEWQGWPEWKSWESIEGECKFQSGNDGRGHIALHLALCSGHYDRDWRIEVPIFADAGQLEEIARKARRFFGEGQ